ncbi:IS21 family transposase [uncultured Thiocystis sp.]|uniref:IS21 family transposase n=1 Tax=uncultured Thiocystis sp. TaxID=1202134 RepID=UPI0025E7616B|nr:IS21 family transposase [uncultured Thiocystis sp.]
MPRERLSMRKIHEILRLSWGAQVSLRAVSKTLGIGKSTVSDCLKRAQAAGLSWPLPADLDEGRLERLLDAQEACAPRRREALDWVRIQRELRGKGVTLFLLWQEYRECTPDGDAYSRFCDLYGQWRGQVDVVMRQSHRAGEKLFVDDAGQTVDIVDARSGEVQAAQIFVAVLGASSDTYAEATRTQGLADWIGSHVRALAFFNGAPEIIVPDNLRSAVSKACRDEPDLNPTDQDFARHDEVAVIPARVRKPRDKAKAEGGVLLVERWILARLRHQTFFSLAALNAAIDALLTGLNERPFKKLGGSRRSHFETIDRPALRPLPPVPYEYAEWRKARVAPNIHLEIEGHYYSVPHTLVKRPLDVRLTATTVEVLHQGQRVASHVRSTRRGGYTTVAAHMPEAHQRYLDWTPERLLHWAEQHGPSTRALIACLLAKRTHPQQGFNAAFGVMRLGKDDGEVRLEAACARALAIGTVSDKSLASILAKGLDQRPLPSTIPESNPIVHPNVRGAGYYH